MHITKTTLPNWKVRKCRFFLHKWQIYCAENDEKILALNFEDDSKL